MNGSALSRCLIILTLGCAVDSANANPIDYTAILKAADFGDLDQRLLDAACGNLPRGCGPAAAANSFRFLEKTYPDTYGGKLVVNPQNKDFNNDGVDAKDSLIATATELIGANYMKTCCGGPREGTKRNNFVTGKQKYIEERVPNATVYEVMDDPELNKDDFTWTPDLPAGVYKSAIPTPQFLSANLKSKEDVEIMLGAKDPDGEWKRHFVTLTGLSWIDKDEDGKITARDGEAKISYVNSWAPAGEQGGKEVTRVLTQDATGRLLVHQDGKQMQIQMVVKESLKPPKSVVKDLSVTGPAKKSVSFDAATGALSLSPFELTAAHIAERLGFLDVDRVDPEFVGDPILGATVSVSPFYLGQTFPDGSVAFGGFDGVVTISKGSDVFLTAFVPTLMFDPALVTPFYAPLQILSLNTSLGSAFIGQMQSRLADPNELPFDLFIAPDGDFLRATNHFTVSANMGVNAGIAQNGHVPEPSTLTLLGIGAASMLGYAWRRRQ